MKKINWILAKTSLEANVGATARAIKTMGSDKLLLAAPKNPNVAQHPDAIALASGADDVLRAAKVYNSVSEACAPFQWVFGLTSREREFGPPAISLPEASQLAARASLNGENVAFLFGAERTGLENEDFSFCTHRVWIDANPQYPSLNLAQAVMVCAYEMRRTLQNSSDQVTNPHSERATQIAIESAMEHWKAGLIAIGYLDPAHPKKLMERIRALFDRAGLQKEEVDLIRGIAKQMLLKK
jgi:tRNA/rRNA methyltransferase